MRNEHDELTAVIIVYIGDLSLDLFWLQQGEVLVNQRHTE